MRGPVAPKDPEKHRPFFYIMRDKQVFGSKQKDGSGVQFIYENDGRLLCSAQIVGNITGERELEMLKTVKGFRQLVHSIGVSVEMPENEDPVTFLFQMYGKKDLYGGGTRLSMQVEPNGAEHRLYLADASWMADDEEPGQIRFVFQEPEKLARVNVRFYLNDGFLAPEQDGEEPIDEKAVGYQNMIARSLLSKGNLFRMQKAIRKAEEGEDVTLAFIGGSITQGAGAIPIHTECYAYKTFQLFKERFTGPHSDRNEKSEESVAADEDCKTKKAGVGKNHVHLLKAGVGGTSSELGMIRFDRDVLRNAEKPDIVVVEYAVNDEGDETHGDCYESLVRKILALPWRPAVILLFMVFADDFTLQERFVPIGEKYDLPMISIRDAVTQQFHLTKEQGRVLTRNQFFYDRYHPTNAGHTIIAKCMDNLFAAAQEMRAVGLIPVDVTEELLQQEPVIGKTFEQVKLLERVEKYENANIRCGGFYGTDTDLQCVEMDDQLTMIPEFPHNWMYDGTQEKERGEKMTEQSFRMNIRCRALLLVSKDSGELDAGRADVWVDHEYVLTADPHLNGWTHCNPLIILEEAESREHEIEIRMYDGDENKKFTILGFGYVR